MSRSFRYWSRCALVVALTLLVTFNPAWAGRGLRGWLKKRVACQPCCEVVVCCPQVTPACGAPVDCGCSVPVVSSCDCCGVSSTVLEHSGVDHGTVVAPAQVPPATDHAHDAPPSADQTAPVPAPSAVAPSAAAPSAVVPEVSPSDVAPAAIAPQVEAPEPVTEPEAPAQEPVVEEPLSVAPAPIVEDPEPLADQPEAPAAEPEPTVEQPEPFLDEPEQPVVDPEPPAAEPEAPALEPEARAADSETPATDQDLFGSEPAADDLFGDAAPAAPDSESVSDSGDDLFDEPSSAEAPSTVQNADDDLFGAPSQPADDTADDLFGDTSSEASQDPTDSNEQENAEDLFSTPATPVQEDNEVEESPAIPSVDAEDDLFGIPSEGTQDEKNDNQDSVDLFGLDEDRTWRDNTGTFQVDARLVEIHSGYVRLQKTNGRFCQVPLRRLSVGDRALVELIASSLPPGGSKFVSTPSQAN